MIPAYTCDSTHIDAKFRPKHSKRIVTYNPADLDFKKITQEDMDSIAPLLDYDFGRTTDFSYGGLLMWVDYFSYEYCIIHDTLFVKGVLEDDRDVPAFSLPIGEMRLEDAINMLKGYCQTEGIPLELSAVPEYAIKAISELQPKEITELAEWGDYLYDADVLASLSGKKMGKKRNHVNRFNSLYPTHKLVAIEPRDYHDLLAFMDEYETEADHNESANAERTLTKGMIKYLCENHHKNILGAKLVVDDKIVAFTIGDVKHDTLYVHVEKALREYDGAYEAINTLFVRHVQHLFPEVRYVNREDDAGDPGLRQAKLSYHPLEVLRKFNVKF